MYKRFLVLIALLMLGFFVAGCADGSKSSEVTNPNPDVFSPVGSISGVVYDYCTEAPVKGAVVSVAYAGRVHSVTTSTNGTYSFSNVPATGSVIAGGGCEYTVSCDLTKVTGYGYAMVGYASVYFTSLHDGLNENLPDEATEGGSGASTPINNMASTLDFTPGPLTSGLSGSIYDVSTGRALSGATVALYYGSTYRASVTSTDGSYSFANIIPGSYSLMVTKAGYEYAALQAPNTVVVGLHEIDDDGYGGGSSYSAITPECNLVDVYCAIGCGQVKAGVNVNMIANPAKDKTVPYIVSARVGDELDVIRDDVFPDMTPDDITAITFTFSEAMQASRSLKGNAVFLNTDIDVIVTSGGVGATLETTLSDQDFVKSYTVTMTSAGIMIITPTLKTAADYAAAAGYGPTATFAYDGTGSVRVRFEEWAGSPHLTDASFNPWSIGTKLTPVAYPGSIDALGYLHSFGEAYQDYFILGGGHHLEITIGE